MRKKKMKIGELKIDPKLTAIRHINTVFVSRYRQAYRMGETMPPLIIEEGTNRVVSGNHRLTALLKEFNKDHKTEVIVKHYASELEVMEDFVHENTRHGYAIDDFTRKKMVLTLIKEGSPSENVAKIFNVPVRRIEQIGDGVIQVELRTGKIEERPVKRGFEPERIISEEQWEKHANHDRGLSVVQQATQLARWLDQDLVTYSESNLNAIEALKKGVDGYLENVPEKAAV